MGVQGGGGGYQVDRRLRRQSQFVDEILIQISGPRKHKKWKQEL